MFFLKEYDEGGVGSRRYFARSMAVNVDLARHHKRPRLNRALDTG